MNHMLLCILALTTASSLAACSKLPENAVEETSIPQYSELSSDNKALTYLMDAYAMRFKLRCSDGHDLYVFYIFPDHAERSCDMLMPANSNDVSVYNKNLSWKVDGDELIISGEWEESFTIDISTQTAASTLTGKVYQIIEPD